MPYKTCCVPGCHHSSTKDGHLAFFSLPTETKRRNLWLRLIAREELANKDPRNYTVCEKHFERRHLLRGPTRQTLKKLSVPTVYLPPGGNEELAKLHRKELAKLAAVGESMDRGNQTMRVYMSSVSVQTESYLSWLPMRKKPGVKVYTQTTSPYPPVKEEPREEEDGADEIHTLYDLCDKYLSKSLADLVKLQTVLRLRNKK